MTLFYYDPIFQEHRTGQHPERPERLSAVMRHLQFTGLDASCTRPAWTPISQERLVRVHSLEYVQRLQQFCAAGGGWLESDTVVVPRSFDVALSVAGAVCDATERVLKGESRNAFCLVRPPGHHALQTDAMGFCLFNNIALAAQVACVEFGLDRVLIVDWDVHHGNGTQDSFWEEARVGFFSAHRWPFYPGTGAADETGRGDGLGTTVNLPVPFGTSRADYRRAFQAKLETLADKLRPQLVLISAGFDAHRADPVGSLGLETEDFLELTRVVGAIAQTHAEGRIVSALEGGYNPEMLAECVETHLGELLRLEE